MITSKLASTAIVGSLINSTSVATRTATQFAIGSMSEVAAGTVSRFAGTMVSSGFDLEKSAQSAFDGKSMLFDGVLGGVSNAVSGIKAPNSVETLNNIDDVVTDGGGKYSAFGDMSEADGLKYNQYWDDVSKSLDTDTRVKLNQWNYRPDADLYIKYRDVYDNPKYFDQETGKIYWPEDDGFALETKRDIVVKQDYIFKRYGEPTGEFLGNSTDSFESRALAPHSEKASVYYYRLTEDMEMTSGEAAPWFGSEGGAEQFVKYKSDGTKYSIQELIDLDILEDITDLVESGMIKID